MKLLLIASMALLSFSALGAPVKGRLVQELIGSKNNPCDFCDGIENGDVILKAKKLEVRFQFGIELKGNEFRTTSADILLSSMDNIKSTNINAYRRLDYLAAANVVIPDNYLSSEEFDIEVIINKTVKKFESKECIGHGFCYPKPRVEKTHIFLAEITTANGETVCINRNAYLDKASFFLGKCE